MELRHLHYFVAIAEERSFTRAAERLWIAQPGLSTQIRRLEAELGVQLFERHTRGVDLTEAGEVFLERARVTLAAAAAARAVGPDLQAGLAGSIRLGVVKGAGWPGASSLLAAFGRDRPNVELTVFESYAGTVLRDLRDGRLDGVLAPTAFASGDLRRVVLGHDPWLVLAGPAHRLAARTGPVEPRELRGAALVVTGHRDGAAYDRVVAETLAGLGIALAPRRGGAGPALFAAVAAGDAIGLTTSADAAAAGMVARRLEPAPVVEHALLWRDADPAPALGHLIAAATARADRPARPALLAVA